MRNLFVFIIFVFLIATLSSCERPKQPDIDLKAVTFSQLPSWHKDNQALAWPAFLRSCVKINSLAKKTVFLNGNDITDWQQVCGLALSLKNPTPQAVRAFFEAHFTPYQVRANGETQGLFTGYYEPEVNGSHAKTGQFSVPLYKRPKDLVMIEDLGIFRKELRGIRVAGKVVNGNLKPYYTHAQIDNGALAGNELLWIEDPVDAFFIQIQGSSAIKLANGELIHLVYAGTNGHPYTAIGKVLIDQNALTSKNVSMQAIRAWLKTNPEQVKEVLHQNASYVFFNEKKGDGPIGDEEVVLTPGRSLAIDPRYISYGTPIWLNADHPTSKERLQRLVIAQDKGGAIKGPIRGDLFWGTGHDAGEMAGQMKSKGSYYVLLPKGIKREAR